MPQALKEAGYNTAIIGKWHLGHADPKYWPRQRGFDYQYGPMIGELDYFTQSSTACSTGIATTSRHGRGLYDDQLLGNDAVKLIDEHDPEQRRSILYLAFNAPHTPYQAPQDYLDRYPNIEDPTRRAYAAQITAMDDEIGRVVAALDKKGMRDNTLIVFQSDNGGTRNAMFAGERRHVEDQASQRQRAVSARAKGRSMKAARALSRAAPTGPATSSRVTSSTG